MVRCETHIFLNISTNAMVFFGEVRSEVNATDKEVEKCNVIWRKRMKKHNY